MAPLRSFTGRGGVGFLRYSEELIIITSELTYSHISDTIQVHFFVSKFFTHPLHLVAFNPIISL